MIVRFVQISVFLLVGCCLAIGPSAAASAADGNRQVTLLFTNDFESAYDPTPAFWRQDMTHIGGIAELAALVAQFRQAHAPVFLFDAGDIFTGTLAKLTRGAISFELMMTMGYDAMVIGNHEFEYGWEALVQAKHRVPFPVLGANLFYRGTRHPYAQPYAIIEKQGVRIGVIGVLGEDAATALVPSHIAGVDVLPPAPILRRHVATLRNQVDMIVVLTHQGYTAPMQTDDEADPSVHRGNQENVRLAGEVPGIDVILAGHTDAGTRQPIVHPQTGTVIMQTFGQGQHLGVLQFVLPDPEAEAPEKAPGRPRLLEGRLEPVDSDRLQPHPAVAAKLERYRAQHPQIYTVIGRTQAALTRRYYHESDLGNLFADILREHSGAQVALMPSGALRRDLPAGAVRQVDLLDAFPFQDRVATLTLSGQVLLQVLEQGLSLQRGMLQISGMTVEYDPSAPVGERVISAAVAGVPLQTDASYEVATLEILAQGGDAYVQFAHAEATALREETFAALLQRHFRHTPLVEVPPRGRLHPAGSQPMGQPMGSE